MKVIIVGDESKARENLTRVMFDITLQNLKKDGGNFEKEKRKCR